MRNDTYRSESLGQVRHFFGNFREIFGKSIATEFDHITWTDQYCFAALVGNDKK